MSSLFDGILELQVATKAKDFSSWKWNHFAKVLISVDIVWSQSDTIVGHDLIEMLLDRRDFLKDLACVLDKKISAKDFKASQLELPIRGLKILLASLDVEDRQKRILENLLKDFGEPAHVKSNGTIGFSRKSKNFSISSLLVDNKEILEPLSVSKRFENTREYLNVYRNLFIEDFFGPLRKALRALEIGNTNSSDIYSYGEATVCHTASNCLTVLLNISQRIDWTTTSRLLKGSLVIVQHSNQKLTVWTVKERNIYSKGKLEIILNAEGEDSQSVDIRDNVQVFESPIYFEAYVHVIRAVCSMERVPSELEDPLVKLTKDIKIRNISELHFERSRGDSVPTSAHLWQILNTTEEPVFEKFNFAAELGPVCNESQMRAIQKGLEYKVGLIQGPPGTGKSYVGAILAKILTANTRKPIVVVCFTNHALDTFLENLLDYTSKIVRVGGRSRSSKLEPFNLSAIKQYLKDTSKRNGCVYKVMKSLEESLRLSGSAKDKQRISEWNDFENLNILSKAKIIGFTTTGAAKNHRLLRLLDPEILMIEEAGQVLETHILASLTPNVKQLILIGDHQQLKPTVANYELSRDYNLDLSLFERLIRNGFDFAQLQEQHRMRPEISNVIRSEFYPDLKDHRSVRSYPNVKGCNKNLFFLNHREIEESMDDSMSKINKAEANFLFGLASYLVLCHEYEPTRITILTTYLGQMMLIESMTRNNPELRDVTVSVVDNYQGEENDIILLSLVRSNEEANIGYLKLQNRMCVALSRARHGLFVVGNSADLCRRSKRWASITKRLQKNEQFGLEFELQCAIHSTSKCSVNVSSPASGFTSFCQMECSKKLSCGHFCQFLCHFDDKNHKSTHQCPQVCLNSCNFGHKCEKPCRQPCYPCDSKVTFNCKDCGKESEGQCPMNNVPNVCQVVREKSCKFCNKVKAVVCGQKEVICDSCDSKRRKKKAKPKMLFSNSSNFGA